MFLYVTMRDLYFDLEFERIPNAESMIDDLASGGVVEIRRQI